MFLICWYDASEKHFDNNILKCNKVELNMATPTNADFELNLI